MARVRNPHGDEQAAKRIVDILGQLNRMIERIAQVFEQVESNNQSSATVVYQELSGHLEACIRCVRSGS